MRGLGQGKPWGHPECRTSLRWGRTAWSGFSVSGQRSRAVQRSPTKEACNLGVSPACSQPPLPPLGISRTTSCECCFHLPECCRLGLGVVCGLHCGCTSRGHVWFCHFAASGHFGDFCLGAVMSRGDPCAGAFPLHSVWGSCQVGRASCLVK